MTPTEVSRMSDRDQRAMGKRIRLARELHGKSLAELARQLASHDKKPEMHRAYSSKISAWELGKVRPSDKAIRLLAKFYGVSAEWLLTGTFADGMANGFGDRLKGRLEELELSVDDEMGGVVAAKLRAWIDGKVVPSRTVLSKVAEVLDTTPEWLLFGDRPKTAVELKQIREEIRSIEKHLLAAGAALGRLKSALTAVEVQTQSSPRPRTRASRREGPKLVITEKALRELLREQTEKK
jgi:transcriptional regulator with XRE-family HTH domain